MRPSSASILKQKSIVTDLRFDVLNRRQSHKAEEDVPKSVRFAKNDQEKECLDYSDNTPSVTYAFPSGTKDVIEIDPLKKRQRPFSASVRKQGIFQTEKLLTRQPKSRPPSSLPYDKKLRVQMVDIDLDRQGQGG